MVYLILIATLLAFLAGTLVLFSYEARSGKRILAGTRYKADKKIASFEFVLAHVDWGAFSADVTRTTLLRIAHDITHSTLLAVRATERLLTRFVRSLRSQRTLPAVPHPSRLSAMYRTVIQSIRRAKREPEAGEGAGPVV